MKPRLDLHESLSRDEEVKRPSERRFGLTFGVVFLLLTALLTVRGSAAWPVPLALASAFLGLTVFAPELLRPLNQLWLRFGLALHTIISPVVLLALFFVAVTPVAVVARLLGNDFLRLRFNREATTYWIDRRPPGPRPESMRNQF
jgi:Saxitoxin biosynthesis operon protein SxtJ